jgi:hypothetical protein
MRPDAACTRSAAIMSNTYVIVFDTNPPLRDAKLVCHILLHYGRFCEIRGGGRGEQGGGRIGGFNGMKRQLT